ncbi:(S)-acetoin forming diacetyl reductase [Microlunatus spumicola]|uniref:(S)-acetoin forming diacetyl reductase n=1 Tax=Microlunatus spumicola TaxID=81499 RepID=A0ABP6X6U9_9ACTN
MTNAALVTGAGSGMGLATARRYLDDGWTVLALDASGVALEVAAADLGERFVPVVADVTDGPALTAAIAAAAEGLALKVVVNAAGIYPPSTLDDYTDELFHRVFGVNVLGVLNVCRATVPLLRAAGGGGIVNFSSVDAIAVSEGQLVYSASKAAVSALTRSLAVELAPDITVNGVAPGWVDTPGNAATGRMEGAARTIPLRRVAQPSEVAHWVAQLAGGGAYVTGETLVISGGSLIR